MIGVLGGFGRGAPSTCMGTLVVFRSLLLQIHRNLLWIPPQQMLEVEKNAAYQLFTHFWIKSTEIFSRSK